MSNDSDALTKSQELRSFVFLAAIIAPVLAVVIVAGYGFLVWFYQMLAGPPGS
ncbi:MULTISPECIES: periplasmic nitrate reductase, NapE protein [unclassified Achromobacter]|uniref:periplasmic nitrate reductase, NapE protein n=1 Tax=unclassified Achromobacter TaxID=2626865 RepID=UPI00069E4FE4|nr:MULTISPECIES: periplasmic nitrate reductase, NapE protein [unclassified Achromobacter]KOF52517.1 nitrate reductase [Achromobacter sp. DMS1]